MAKDYLFTAVALALSLSTTVLQDLLSAVLLHPWKHSATGPAERNHLTTNRVLVQQQDNISTADRLNTDHTCTLIPLDKVLFTTSKHLTLTVQKH